MPDAPGGGTVAWTNPWGGHRFVDSIEAREDGGTPGFLQTIRAALPQAQGHAFDDANHFVLEDKHEVLVPAIRKFLDTHPL